MQKIRLLLALMAVCLVMGACSDDDPAKPREFAVTIQVTDTNGLPVEGLRIGLVKDHPFFPDGGKDAKAAVAIPFWTLNDVTVRLTVEDIEGQLVQVVSEGAIPAGSHQWVWDGTNDQGIHQPSGRYTAHLVATNAGSGDQVFEDRVDMLLPMLDSSRVPAGFTDQNGRLVLKDKKLFPHLYDRPAMVATDENGELVGLLTLTPMMRISLVDTVAGKSMGFKEDILQGTVLNLVWDPPLATTAFAIVPDLRGTFPITSGAIEDPEPVMELGPVFPNPFNSSR